MKQTDKQKALNRYLHNQKIAYTLLSERDYPLLEESIIYQILAYELEHWEHPPDIIFRNLSVDEICSIIIKYFAVNGLPDTEITLKDSILNELLVDELYKANVKFKGEIWTIHRNDKDSFPSNPHAHNYENHFCIAKTKKVCKKDNFVV